MADSPASTESRDSEHEAQDSSRNKIPATKDRTCQYCGQEFTSSSLGRHLDQFLSKKKPDGIHDVDEIRRLRGGITRRAARHGKEGEGDISINSNSGGTPAQTFTPVVDINARPPGGVRNQFNTLDWQATGVINNLPVDSPPALNSATKRSFAAFANDGTVTNDKDQARALELALKEVLDSIRVATARAVPRSTPFDFELESKTFPALCIELLPLPPTLDSMTPFSTSTSCPIDPPGSNDRECLRTALFQQINRWKWDCVRIAQSQKYPTAIYANLGEEADYLGRVASQYDEIATRHLDLAYSAWASQSTDSRSHMWQIELMRAFAHEKKRNKDLETQIDNITKEANRLQMQVDYLSRCQWPREMALWPPERVRFSKVEADEVRGITVDISTDVPGEEDQDRSRGSGGKWDFDRIVNKWKKHVREDKTRRTGMAATGIPAVVPPSVNGSGSIPYNTNNDKHIPRLSSPSTVLQNLRPPSPLGTSKLSRHSTMTPNPAAVAGPPFLEDGSRRRSMRQLQQQHHQQTPPDEAPYHVGPLADKTEEVRQFIQDLADTKNMMISRSQTQAWLEPQSAISQRDDQKS